MAEHRTIRRLFDLNTAQELFDAVRVIEQELRDRKLNPNDVYIDSQASAKGLWINVVEKTLTDKSKVYDLVTA
jgi:hypothetical protein